MTCAYVRTKLINCYREHSIFIHRIMYINKLICNKLICRNDMNLDKH
jgi:hypothetical protein